MDTTVAVSVRPYAWKTGHPTSQSRAQKGTYMDAAQLMFGSKASTCAVNSADVGAAPTTTALTLERS